MTLAAVKRSSSTLTWTGAALLMTLVVSVPELRAQDASSWPAQSDQFRFHMIGNAHIDPCGSGRGPRASQWFTARFVRHSIA